MNTEKKIWDYFIKKGLSPAGTAGLMGNLKAESGLIFNRVEILCLKRLKENGYLYTDESYTTAIDNGKITRSRFLNPLPGKQYGYGLAQWTTPARKAGLYDLVKSRGVSIADPDTQLDYLIKELIESYPSVYKVLQTAKTVREASDIVLVKFESPADTGVSVKTTRASYGQSYLDKFANTNHEKKGGRSNDDNKRSTNETYENIQRGIGILRKEINAQLDSKTANAGLNNYTKYWRDIANWGLGNYNGPNGYWCAGFIFWGIKQAFGLEKARKMLLHAPFINCQTIYNLFNQKCPKRITKVPARGRLVLFKRSGVFGHVGMVTKTSNGRFYTYEGNTSNGTSVVPNGGEVCYKNYDTAKLVSEGARFIDLDWSIVSSGFDVEKGQKYTLTTDITIRTEVSTTTKQAGYKNIKILPIMLKRNALKTLTGKCKLRKGNTVEALAVKKNASGDIWIKIKSGWLPVRVNEKFRVKRA